MKRFIRQRNTFFIKTAIIGLVSIMSLAGWAQPALRVQGSIYLKLLLDQHGAEINNASGMRLDFVGNGVDVGIVNLVNGQADVASIVGPLDDVVKKINTKTTGAVDPSKLKTIPLGFAKYVLVVNPNNPVRRITTQQAAGLLSGRIKNWKELGGPDQMVIPVVPPMGSGAAVTFENLLLHAEKWSPDARIVNSTIEIRSAVSQSVRAVGTISVAALTDKVVPLTLDTELQTPVSLVVLGEPTPSVQKLAEAIRPFVK